MARGLDREIACESGRGREGVIENTNKRNLEIEMNQGEMFVREQGNARGKGSTRTIAK